MQGHRATRTSGASSPGPGLREKPPLPCCPPSPTLHLLSFLPSPTGSPPFSHLISVHKLTSTASFRDLEHLLESGYGHSNRYTGKNKSKSHGLHEMGRFLPYVANKSRSSRSGPQWQLSGTRGRRRLHLAALPFLAFGLMVKNGCLGTSHHFHAEARKRWRGSPLSVF